MILSKTFIFTFLLARMLGVIAMPVISFPDTSGLNALTTRQLNARADTDNAFLPALLRRAPLDVTKVAKAAIVVGAAGAAGGPPLAAAVGGTILAVKGASIAEKKYKEWRKGKQQMQAAGSPSSVPPAPSDPDPQAEKLQRRVEDAILEERAEGPDSGERLGR